MLPVNLHPIRVVPIAASTPGLCITNTCFGGVESTSGPLWDPIMGPRRFCSGKVQDLGPCRVAFRMSVSSKKVSDAIEKEEARLQEKVLELATDGDQLAGGTTFKLNKQTHATRSSTFPEAVLETKTGIGAPLATIPVFMKRVHDRTWELAAQGVARNCLAQRVLCRGAVRPVAVFKDTRDGQKGKGFLVAMERVKGVHARI